MTMRLANRTFDLRDPAEARAWSHLFFNIYGVWPMAGADDGDGDGDGDGGDDGGSDDGDDGDDDSGDGDGDDDSDGDGDDDSGDGDGDDDDDQATTAKAEAAEAKAEAKALKRRVEDAEKRARKAERDLKNRKQADREEQGEFKEMAEEEKKQRIAAEKKLRDRALETSVTAVATKLKFRNPSVAHKLVDLPDDVVDEDGEVDEGRVERALKRLAKDEDYLVRGRRSQSRDDVKGDKSETSTSRNGGKSDDESRSGMEMLRDAYAQAESD
jgi:hypothetical protein